MSTVQLRTIASLMSRLPAKSTATPKVAAILERLRKEAAGVTGLVSNPDKMKSEAANSMVLNNERSKLRELAAAARQEVAGLIASAQAAQDADRVARANLVAVEHAAEIRTIFRGLDSNGQAKFMADALRSKDGSVVAALVGVPAILTGMSQEQVDLYREHFLDSITPGARGERDVRDELTAVCDGCLTAIDQIAAPTA